MPAPAPDGSTAADPAAVDPAAALPGAQDAKSAAEPDEAASAPDDLDEDLKREAAIFEDRDPAEILRDFRTKNYWDFSDRNEDIFSGREVNEIAEEADRMAAESAAVDIVRLFLRINHNDRAALDLFAVAGRFSEEGEKEIDRILNDTRDEISERIRRGFSQDVPPDVLERIIKTIHA